jgi:hypothetical protein
LTIRAPPSASMIDALSRRADTDAPGIGCFDRSSSTTPSITPPGTSAKSAVAPAAPTST